MMCFQGSLMITTSSSRAGLRRCSWQAATRSPRRQSVCRGENISFSKYFSTSKIFSTFQRICTGQLSSRADGGVFREVIIKYQDKDIKYQMTSNIIWHQISDNIKKKIRILSILILEDKTCQSWSWRIFWWRRDSFR